MFKTYTLIKIEEEQLTDTEGKITFIIIDENNELRKVFGTTKLDADQKVVSISTTKKREHPLIQCLFNTEINETVNVEFDQYNALFKRDDNKVTAQTVEELAKEMQNKPVRLGPLLKSTQIKSTESIH